MTRPNNKRTKRVKAFAVGFKEEFDPTYIDHCGLEIFFDKDKANLRAGFLFGVVVPVIIIVPLPTTRKRGV